MSKIYPYPAVQYIPLSLGILFHQDNLPTEAFLLIGREIPTGKELIEEKLGIQLPPFAVSADQLLLFAGGMEPLEAKYRGYYVTIKVTRRSSIYLISMPKHYFYKDTLVFQAKNENGETLVSKCISLNKC